MDIVGSNSTLVTAQSWFDAHHIELLRHPVTRRDRPLIARPGRARIFPPRRRGDLLRSACGSTGSQRWPRLFVSRFRGDRAFTDKQTGARPCYPAKDQRELAAECRRLKSMLVPDKRSLPEISSFAHVAAPREGCLPLVKQLDSLICPRTERGFYGGPLLPDQATF